MKSILKIFIMVMFATTQLANGQKIFEIPLYNGEMPNSNGLTGDEDVNISNGNVGNITKPTLTIYQPEESIRRDKAVVVCPGGGYHIVSMDNEGHNFAKRLVAEGYTVIIVKYRMPNGHHQVPISDLTEAMYVARSRAKEWGYSPDQIALVVFSAGGHLASTLLAHGYGKSHKGVSTYPNFGALIYPVITMDEAYTHNGSKVNLLGKNPSAEQVEYYSNEHYFGENTPPLFIAHSSDDKVVNPHNSILLFNQMNSSGNECELHIYPTGGHGWCTRGECDYREDFFNALIKWLGRV